MKNIVFISLFFICGVLHTQTEKSFKSGEILKYKISYSGWFKSGKATVSIDEKKINNIDVYHSKISGKTIGPLNLIFKVRDNYESYFSKKDLYPIKFIRNINEGGYKKNVEIDFDFKNRIANVKDLIKNKTRSYKTNENVQDMVSVFYFIRSSIDIDKLIKDGFYEINMFFDSENYLLKIKYLSTEIINTNFGKVLCYKIRPYVQSGRVFKKNESITMWVSADKNKIPVRIKANLLVGSVRADLESYSGLLNPFVIQF